MSALACEPLPVPLLPGEGETKMIVRTRVRIACGNCGEPATHRHTYSVAERAKQSRIECVPAR
jgi:hypothetical protein